MTLSPSTIEPPRPWWTRPWAISLGLALVVLLPYLQLWTQQFINYDDNVFVYDNYYVQNGFSLEGFRWAFGIHGPSQWHPLTWLSHMLDTQVFGLWAGGHKLHNVALHIANTILIYHVLRLMTDRNGPAALVAVLFGLHPMRVEAVAWVAERKEVLSSFFALWGLLAYWWYTRRPGPGRYSLVLICFVLSLLAKPMFITMPFVLLLLDYWPLQRLTALKSPEDWKKLGSLLLEKLPFFPIIAVASLLTLLCQYDARTVYQVHWWTMSMRIANAAVAYCWYLKTLFVPLNLIVLYPIHRTVTELEIAACMTAILGLTWLLIRASRRFPYLGVGWLWFLGILVPMIGLVQVGDQAYADRYSYMSSIGLLIIVVWSGADVLSRIDVRGAVVGMVVAATVLVLAMLTFMQAGYWVANLPLYTHALDVSRQNTSVLINLAVADENLGDLDGAESLYRETLSILPEDALAMNNLGRIYLERGDPKVAAQFFRSALRVDQHIAAIYDNMGTALFQLKQYEFAERAFRRAIELEGTRPRWYQNLALVLMERDRADEAVAAAKIAIRLRPSEGLSYEILAEALIASGRFDEAIPQAREAMKRNPLLEKKTTHLIDQAKKKIRRDWPTTLPE